MEAERANPTPCENGCADLDEDVAMLPSEEAEASKKGDPQGREGTPDLRGFRVMD